MRRFAAALVLTLLAVSLVPTGTVAAGDLVGTLTGTLTGAVGAVLDVVPVLVPGSSQPASSATVIDGAKGGVAKCGRFTVVVPPGAWRGNAEVKIRVPDGTRLSCDLSISPSSVNGFSRPVQLQMDALGAVTTSGLVVGYWDPALGRWTRVPGSVQDLLTLKLSAPLWHFSRYGGCEGKAGW